MNSELAFNAGTPAEFPTDQLPEIAVMGRSNVGKSSFINTLVGRKGLARTSSTPGKTRRIYFFGVEGRMYLVDLPGYGYASVGKQERSSWRPMVESYLRGEREALRAAILLIDARRGPGAEELQLLDYLASEEIAAKIVFTKADKLGKAALARSREEVAETLGLRPESIDCVSSTKRTGFGGLAGWLREMTGVEFRRPDGSSF
jgi:GTP-binding protein